MSDLDFGVVLGFGFSPGPPEMLLLLVIALLLYGGKLPAVARSWGKSFAEFRRGLSGIQSDLNEAIYSEPELIEYRDDTAVTDHSSTDDHDHSSTDDHDHSSTDDHDDSSADDQPTTELPSPPKDRTTD